MLGAGLQFGRGCGDDRFYNPTKARRAHQGRQNDQLRRAQSDVSAGQSLVVKPSAVSSVIRETEYGDGCEELPKSIAMSAFEPVVSSLSNLERFLQSIAPSVPAQYLSKTTMKGWRTCDVEFQPYFVLGDLWESFKEWSAYGAGVPLVLNNSDSVVQYYVPYLSGIQIYGESLKSSAKSRQPGEDSDSDFRDSSSDGSSDSEPERALKYMGKQLNHHRLSSELSRRMDSISFRDQLIGLQEDCSSRMDTISFRDQLIGLQEDCSSDEFESLNSQGQLLFEHLERDLPYSREPLADKISDLAFQFPELKTLRSCDLLPSSWFSVAWYPIYRIPTGPTLKDLDACFLTFHYLSSPMGGARSVQGPVVTYPSGIDGIPKMSLPVFGLASYKFRGSLWTPNGGYEWQLANSLLQDAEDWLRDRHVNHPDFIFFSRR